MGQRSTQRTNSSVWRRAIDGHISCHHRPGGAYDCRWDSRTSRPSVTNRNSVRQRHGSGDRIGRVAEWAAAYVAKTAAAGAIDKWGMAASSANQAGIRSVINTDLWHWRRTLAASLNRI